MEDESYVNWILKRFIVLVYISIFNQTDRAASRKFYRGTYG